MKVNLLIGMLMLAVVACNEKSDDNDKKRSSKKEQRVESFERQHLAGEIDGQAWTFVSGRVSPSTEAGKSYLTLWDVNVADPCRPVEVGERSVVAKIALEPARIELSAEKKLTLTVFDGEVVRSKEVKQGVLKVSRVENGRLSGSLLAKHDDKNYLEGTFTVPVCH